MTEDELEKALDLLIDKNNEITKIIEGSTVLLEKLDERLTNINSRLDRLEHPLHDDNYI